jgi:iron complex outermembrane receptor protein
MWIRCLTLLTAVLLTLSPALAVQQQQEKKQEEQEKEKQEEEFEMPRFEEVVVVTASKVEEKLVNAPATLSVISSDTIESSPAQNYGDLLRTVPGVNVSQTSARDINIVARGATSTLATSQLALLDGRTIYQDFFGFVLWDFLPINSSEIKQIEVIRGPASAVWGANAMTGVVNVITKTPREMEGTTFTLGFGGMSRSGTDEDLGTGAVFYANATHADAVNDRLAYKVSGGVYTQDAFPRPTGIIPGSTPPTAYPDYPNQGTTQPKFDARFDYDFPDGNQSLIFGGGIAGTDGIIHSGIGPFDIERGSLLGYGKIYYRRGAMKLNFFTNLLDGDAPALLAIDPTTGQPIPLIFKTQTYDVELGNSHVIGTKHILTYGGNFRYNAFDLSITPDADNRTEGGGYIQDDIFLSEHFRWNIGGRIDKFSHIDDPVFSPRTTFMVKPVPEHTFRVSFNRAYRAPSVVNNFFDIFIAGQVDLGRINPLLGGLTYIFPVAAVGNEDLTQESLTAYEVGYTGTFADRATVSASFYINDTRDSIVFTLTETYTSQNPPPGWPLPPAVLDLLNLLGQGLPSKFTYLNFEKYRDKGVELSLDLWVNKDVSVFANYSYQAEPEPTGFDIEELNIPPRHRFNVGLNFNYGRYFGNASVSYTDIAIWQDVLNFRGPTDAYTLLNAGFGMSWADGRVITSVKGTNLTNTKAQQHLFGDIIKLQLIGELKFVF